jgi:hypothetical protein
MSIERYLIGALRFLADTQPGHMDNPLKIEENDRNDYSEDVALSLETHDEWLWLLILDLLIFCGLAVTSYMSSRKLQTVNPDDFKPKFIRGLIYANGSTIIF